MPTEIIAPTAAVLLLDNNTVLFNTVLNTVLLLDNNTANNRPLCIAWMHCDVDQPSQLGHQECTQAVTSA